MTGVIFLPASCSPRVVAGEPGASRLLVKGGPWLSSLFENQSSKFSPLLPAAFHTRCSGPCRPLWVHASPSSVPRTRCAALCATSEKSFFRKSLLELYRLPSRTSYVHGESFQMFICTAPNRCALMLTFSYLTESFFFFTVKKKNK